MKCLGGVQAVDHRDRAEKEGHHDSHDEPGLAVARKDGARNLHVVLVQICVRFGQEGQRNVKDRTEGVGSRDRVARVRSRGPQRRAGVRAMPGHRVVRSQVHDLVRIRRNRTEGGDAALEASAAYRGRTQQHQAVVAFQAPGQHHAANHACCRRKGRGETLRKALEHHLHNAQVRVERQGPHWRVVDGREVLAEKDAELRRELANHRDDAEVAEPAEVDGALKVLLKAHEHLHDLHEAKDDDKVATQHPPYPVGGEVLVHVAIICHE
mmetsp:Transcript_47355/g.135119  ORF Transcript_47355/g.135119 Transcript_47355/m.135119 type:complete len:267 (+) Transcript_47355:717-1517(+)